MKLFKRKNTKQILSKVDLRSFRFLGEEAEALGLRLDAARKSLSKSTTPWALNHWTKTVEQLVAQWLRLPILHDGDAKMQVIARWTVDYDFYELSDEPVSRLFDIDHFYNRRHPDLTESWDRNRAQRLARAQ